MRANFLPILMSHGPWLMLVFLLQALPAPAIADDAASGAGQAGTPQPEAAKLAALPLAAVPSALRRAEEAFYGTAGQLSAPRLWMFVDPQCSYSMRALAALQPYIASGKVQLALIPLSLLDRENGGESTADALAMLSRPADQMVTAWQTGHLSNAPDPAASQRLDINMETAKSIRLHGTPTFLWRNKDGSEGRLDRVPTDMDALVQSLER